MTLSIVDSARLELCMEVESFFLENPNWFEAGRLWVDTLGVHEGHKGAILSASTFVVRLIYFVCL